VAVLVQSAQNKHKVTYFVARLGVLKENVSAFIISDLKNIGNDVRVTSSLALGAK
jgi:hypothetical protein